MEAVKIPKKFADICALIRDGQADGIEKLNAYQGLERQKAAVLAEVAYFEGDWENALSLDMGLCAFWDEWHYCNISVEHTAAMAFAARLLSREDEVVRFFKEQIAFVESNPDMPAHIRNSYKVIYEHRIEYIKSGIMPYATEDETYGKIEDSLAQYELVKDDNLSTMWHIKALSGYNYTGDTKKAFEVVLRMARQRLWFVAAVTQVRPMEFFTHPSIYGFLSDKGNLERITQAATRG